MKTSTISRVKSKKTLIISIVATSVLVITALAIIAMSKPGKLGNPQAIVGGSNFCCQTRSNVTYFTLPNSNEILTYIDGSISSAYKTKGNVNSIYDNGTSLIISGNDQDDNNYVSAIDKKTGAEKVIITFTGEYAAILNVINGVLYYESVPFDEAGNISEVRIHAYDLRTGANQEIANGICCISEDGIYNVKGSTGQYELWFYKLNKHGLNKGKKICDISQSLDCEVLKILKCFPIRAAEDWLYFSMLCSINGGEVYQTYRIRLSTLLFNTTDWEAYSIDTSLNVLNGYIYYINSSNGQLDSNRVICRREATVDKWSSTEKTVTPVEDYINDFCVFPDSTDPQKSIIATWNCYSTITFWDEDGNKITDYKANN